MLPVHGVFLGLGVLAAALVFIAEARRRGAVNEQSLVAVTGALVGGAIGMRLSGWAEHLDLRLNPPCCRRGNTGRAAFSAACWAPTSVC